MGNPNFIHILSADYQANLSILILAVHGKVKISAFGLYISQMLMDFAQIWVILKLAKQIPKTTEDRCLKTGPSCRTETAVRAQDLGQVKKLCVSLPRVWPLLVSCALQHTFFHRNLIHS